jgi:hypothetical protein
MNQNKKEKEEREKEGREKEGRTQHLNIWESSLHKPKDSRPLSVSKRYRIIMR